MLLDIGMGELFVLAVIAAVVLGPEKVPPLARKLARVLGFLRKVANDTTDQIKTELGEEFADLKVSDLHPKNLVQTILPDGLTSDMRSEMEALRSEVAALRSQTASLQLAGPGPGGQVSESREGLLGGALVEDLDRKP